MKITNVKRWNSTGNEFEEQLEKRKVNYKVIFRELKVFRGVAPGIAGGRHFTVYEYIKKDGQRVLAANGGFGVGDYVVEELYLIELDDDKEVAKEEVAELLRKYIKEEESAEQY